MIAPGLTPAAHAWGWLSIGGGFHVGPLSFSLVLGQPFRAYSPAYYYRAYQPIAYPGYHCTDRCFVDHGVYYHDRACPVVRHYFDSYRVDPYDTYVRYAPRYGSYYDGGYYERHGGYYDGGYGYGGYDGYYGGGYGGGSYVDGSIYFGGTYGRGYRDRGYYGRGYDRDRRYDRRDDRRYDRRDYGRHDDGRRDHDRRDDGRRDDGRRGDHDDHGRRDHDRDGDGDHRRHH